MRNITSMLTNNGQQMLANLNGKTLTFTRAVVGQGRSQFPLEWSTKVDKYLKDIIIMSSKTVDNRFVLYLKLNNRDVLYDTYVYQIGIYARLDGETEKLVQIVEGEIGDFVPNQTEIFEKEYEVTIKFENSFADATINIIHEFDASLIDNHNNDENAHPQLKEWVKEQIEKIDVGEVSLNWYNIQNKPSTFPPSNHHHEIDDIYGLEDLLDGSNTIRTDGKENEFLNGQGKYIEFLDITKEDIDILFKKPPTVTTGKNLLINGDFKIWQRGTNFAIDKNDGWVYIADRWAYMTTSNNKVNITKNSSGGIIINTDSKSVTQYFCQTIEVPSNLQGKEVTISLQGNVGTMVVTASDDIKNSMTDGGLMFESFTKDLDEPKTVTIPSDARTITIGFMHVGKMELDWVKLEEGNKATSFVSNSFDEEKKNCLKFFEKLSPTTFSPSSSTSGTLSVQWNIAKRKIPVISIIPMSIDSSDGEGLKLKSSSGKILTSLNTKLTSQSVTKNNVDGYLSGFNGLSTTNTYFLQNEVYVDAEIY